VYGAAFDQGIDPLQVLIDEPVEIRIDERTVWRPADVGPPSGRPMSLREGLINSKNTITAQLMQAVGPSRVAQVAYDMGVRHSKLDHVPSLALGTSPVTLREMVTAFGTIANDGSFVEPVLVTRIENREGVVLQQFYGEPPEPALSHEAAQTLLDVMRGVIDRGTGVGIRKRFRIKADVAGKTGTTQDYTDGWFILMHPQLVAGAWVGFNDNRITMREEWGQGGRSALNVVGDFFQQAIKARAVDPKVRFTAPRRPTAPDSWLGRGNDWVSGTFPARPEPQAYPRHAPWPNQVAQAPHAPLVDIPLVVESPTAPEVVVPSIDEPVSPLP
jgi:penicillin-binding protein 1A